jgi:hypothetical protein
MLFYAMFLAVYLLVMILLVFAPAIENEYLKRHGMHIFSRGAWTVFVAGFRRDMFGTTEMREERERKRLRAIQEAKEDDIACGRADCLDVDSAIADARTRIAAAEARLQLLQDAKEQADR